MSPPPGDRRRVGWTSARQWCVRWSCIPCGMTKSGLPIGLQLLAPAFAEEKLLQTARVFEKATDWHTKRPVIA